jgi:hypothetical protein
MLQEILSRKKWYGTIFLVVIISLIFLKEGKNFMENSKRKQWEILDKDKTYFSFIENCRSKNYVPEDQIQTHHIIPKYAFGNTPEDIAYKDSEDNLIKLSLQDHRKAHELLYEIFHNKQDLGAIKMLSGDLVESRRIWRQLGAEATHRIQKEQNKTFFNSEFQKEMSRRSLDRPDALKIRSKGGKVGGTNRNLDRVIMTNDRYVFSYENVEVLCILNLSLIHI